ncbi:inositol monophosphatase [Telmatospirillum sp. J64-1]|uniref:inositol monophosphatase family protein n=1 Tax=Telmatospirillum sp. J64-1 TaxID=2502183 RepID=UPI00115DE2F1|nr:inositol monophosphatase [Telmatospirillum sp. J64-1]
MGGSGQDISPVPEDTLCAIENRAVELARLAGTEIIAALGRTLAVRYKGDPENEASLKDPVSEVDHEVEVLIRALLGEHFPDHDILGEEIDEGPSRDCDFVWAIDPVDGTTNFVNGFPLFAGSIGVLYRGQPIVGAVWCSTSHSLRPGVYHARIGGPLSFEKEEVTPKGHNPTIRRRLAGEPQATADHSLPWDIRKTGSAAIECAFAAAHLLHVARFERPNVWDVAGGIVLVRAAGGEVRVKDEERGWIDMDRFHVPGMTNGQKASLRDWRRPLIVGDASAVERMCRSHED